MSSIRQTENFIWNEKDKLGKGATANVYRGFDKRTGEVVAVKSFIIPTSDQNCEEKRYRKFEMLEKLNHENIVKFIAIEREYKTQLLVLVMALCEGNCLVDILQDGQHDNGFEDEEFLTIVKHITAAVKHMRENKVVHRDLNPGNILKHIADDRQTVYKVAGTLRELEDATTSRTEAYLHPNLFAKYFLNNYKAFDSNVDLWSIGVTFYQLATGSLPFRTFESGDYDTVYRIISEKCPGVISGVQETMNGPIKWSTTLPKSCALSPSLRKFVEILLAGLLESDHSKIWSFEYFFNYVNFMLSHKPIQVIYVNTVQESIHYLSPTSTFENLKLIVEQEANIAFNSQVYLWNGEEISELKRLDIMSKYPLFVIDNCSKDVKSVNFEYSVEIPDFDKQYANHLLAVKHWQTKANLLKDAVVKCRQQTKMIHSTGLQIEKYFENKVKLNVKNKQSTQVMFNSLKQQFEHINDMNALIVELNRLIIATQSEKSEDIIAKASSKFDSLNVKWNDFDKLFTQMQIKHRTLNEQWIEEECNWDTICATADHHCCSMQETMLPQEVSGITAPDSAILIALSKKRCKNTFHTLHDLFEKTCVPLRKNACHQFKEWYPKIFFEIKYCEWISKLLSEITKQSVELQRYFTSVYEQQKNILKAVKEVAENEKTKRRRVTQ